MIVKPKIILFYIQIILFVMIYFSIVFLRNNIFASFFFLLSNINLVLLFIFHLLKNKLNKSYILFILIIFLVTLLNFAFYNISLSLETLKPFIFFVTTTTFFYICFNSTFDNKFYNFIKFIIIFLSIINIISFNLIKEDLKFGTNNLYITLGFSNPNQTGNWILILLIFLTLYFIIEKKFFIKFLFLVLILLNFYLLTKTLCRSAIVTYAIFIFGLVFFMLKKRKYFKNYELFLIINLPLLFSFLYFLILNSNLYTKFSFFVSEGKSLTSRVGIWTYGFSIIKNNFLLGDYKSGLNLALGQYHNISIDILARYGILVFSFFVYFYYKSIKKLLTKSINTNSLLCIWSFLSIFLYGCFEGGLFNGYMGLNYFIGCFIILFKLFINDKN